MYYLRMDFSDVVSAAAQTNEDFGEAVQTVQNQVVDYMKQKGFSLH